MTCYWPLNQKSRDGHYHDAYSENDQNLYRDYTFPGVTSVKRSSLIVFTILLTSGFFYCAL